LFLGLFIFDISYHNIQIAAVRLNKMLTLVSSPVVHCILHKQTHERRFLRLTHILYRQSSQKITFSM